MIPEWGLSKNFFIKEKGESLVTRGKKTSLVGKRGRDKGFRMPQIEGKGLRISSSFHHMFFAEKRKSFISGRKGEERGGRRLPCWGGGKKGSDRYFLRMKKHRGYAVFFVGTKEERLSSV